MTKMVAMPIYIHLWLRFAEITNKPYHLACVTFSRQSNFKTSILYRNTLYSKFKVLNVSRIMRKPTMWFPNRFDTNRAVQAQKMARSWNFGLGKKRNFTICVAKTKALISFAVIADLCLFSHMQKLVCS